MKMKATIAAGAAAERAAKKHKRKQPTDPTSSSSSSGEEEEEEEDTVLPPQTSEDKKSGGKKKTTTTTTAQTSSFVSADSEVPHQEPVNFGDANAAVGGSRRRVTLGGNNPNNNTLFLGTAAVAATAAAERRNSLSSLSLMDDLFAGNTAAAAAAKGGGVKSRNGSLGGLAAAAALPGNDAASLLGSNGNNNLMMDPLGGGSALGRRGSMESTMGALDAAIFDLTRRRYSMTGGGAVPDVATAARNNSFVGSMMATADSAGPDGLEQQQQHALGSNAARRSSLDMVLAAATAGPSTVGSNALLGAGGSSLTDFGDVMMGSRVASRNNSLSLLSSQLGSNNNNNPISSNATNGMGAASAAGMGGGGAMGTMMNNNNSAAGNTNMMGMMNPAQQQQQALLQQQLSQQQQQQQQQQPMLNPTLALRQQQLQAQQRELERRQRELEQQRRELIASMQQRKMLMQQQQRATALGGFGGAGAAAGTTAGMMGGGFNNNAGGNSNNSSNMMNQQGLMALQQQQQQQQQGFGNNALGNMPFADASLSASSNMSGGGAFSQLQQQGGMAMGNASVRSGDMGTQSGRSSHHSGSRQGNASSHASHDGSNNNTNNNQQRWNPNGGGFAADAMANEMASNNIALAQMQQQMQQQQGFGTNFNQFLPMQQQHQQQQPRQQQLGTTMNEMRSRQQKQSSGRGGHNPSAASTLPHQQRRHSQFGSQSVHTSTTRNSTNSYEPVFSTGPFAPLSKPLPLSMTTDKDWLTPLHCFVRKHCVEVFSATKEDVAAPSKGKRKPIHVGQIGIRCPHCHNKASTSDADMRSRERGSVYYPTTIASIYNATMNLLQRHLHSCPSVPRDAMKRYETLKSDDARSGTSKKYWIESALSLGLVDTETGIRFSPATPPPLPQLTASQKDMQRHEEYYSFEKEDGKEDGKGGSGKKSPKSRSLPKQKGDKSDKAEGAAGNVATQDGSAQRQGPLTAPEDKAYSTAFSYFLLSQMKPCVFTEADRLGKRKGLPPGFPGLACRHCFGGYGSGRFFPSSIKTLSDTSKTLNVLHNHMMRCRKCPTEVKEDLERLRSTHDEERAKMKFGSQKAFFARIWDRLHGTQASGTNTSSSSAAKRKSEGGNDPKGPNSPTKRARTD
eukprot:CAMPEP_0168746786 /NCGR_PEP_ID=MMETSP0724-20121128/15328_1 /TAXON_ID=265536 /ORGANISM="Amphiprora sp., Strain CCMP467" /LENGTH=1129 /DNA_ID=CAMNT_0008794571 /DNA_START=272 /DNA_END=3661 /DNA_ORIENTATION=+